jgi:FkbM family methyltransferase
MTVDVMPRLKRFAKKPLLEKLRSLGFRFTSVGSRLADSLNIPIPIRLDFGVWWLARNDHVGRPLRNRSFEPDELAFVARFVKPGMTVLDLGAHHGLYSLLASKRVGHSGQVFAFEPSPRERNALRLHLTLNFCRNVSVEKVALGNENTESDLHVVDSWAVGCNSLRPPDVAEKTSLERVRVTKLDDWLTERKIGPVHFIKLDVEGGELAALQGASELISNRPRPVILAEVQDVRTRPWGYQAKEIIDFLGSRNYQWFSLQSGAGVAPLDVTAAEFDGNFVACPTELCSELSSMVRPCLQP